VIDFRLQRLAGNQGKLPGTFLKCRISTLFGVQSQIGFPLVGIRSVTGKALVRKYRPYVKVVTDLIACCQVQRRLGGFLRTAPNKKYGNYPNWKI
jgi:hypothetical protein